MVPEVGEQADRRTFGVSLAVERLEKILSVFAFT